MTKHIAVIGSGIVGACVAAALVTDNHRVTLIEPGPVGGEQAASYGNGAWVSPASIIPMSVPGTWKKVPRYLLDPNGPLTIRWRHFPSMLPWLLRFLNAGFTKAKVERTARILTSLLNDAPSRHQKLAEEISRPELIQAKGLLYVYPDRDAFEKDVLPWNLRKQNGVKWQELERANLHALEPTLSEQYNFGALVEQGVHCIDPGAYVAAIKDYVVACGGSFMPAAVTGFSVHSGKLNAVQTNAGVVQCDAAVICAGIHSRKLIQICGDYVPLCSERGYHVVLEGMHEGPSIPIMTSDSKSANTSTRSGLRIAGQVEMAPIEATPNWRRADILLAQAATTYSVVRNSLKGTNVSRWMGHRPSTPDGLPVIDHSSLSDDIIYAFGHGHIGLATAPATAQLVADLIAKRDSFINLEPFMIRRFKL
ncbi:NAD(P)/FAD-dependent oxidoreductase [Falsochrobactrum tianjinense]|nr:FAD-binding oxidoreductase [Falsochrobactrum sp. TDYN1]